jgi:AcrR family transcriptional regulator
VSEARATGNGWSADARSGLPGKQTEEVRRARVLHAARHVLAERGPDGVTVKAVAKRAGIPRSAFYKMFPGIEECILAAARETFSGLDIAASAALLGEGPWRDGVRAALVDLMVSIDPYLDTPVLRQEIERAREAARIRALAATEVASSVVIPPPLSNPKAHRMWACVLFLRHNPGASNAEIARAIDRDHGGQVSRMLKRLEEAGLLIKAKTGRAGHSNAWILSPLGVQAVMVADQASQP